MSWQFRVRDGVVVVVCLWAASVALAQVPARLTEADARHLLTRTGFTPSPAEVTPWVGMAPADAVDRLLSDAAHATPRHAPPAFTAAPARVPYNRLPDDEARRAARREAREDTRVLAVWWLAEMRDSPTPLAERMTLFWHNHFATSEQKVQQPQGMYAQHLLFRRFALGSFRELLQAVARDPAMLVYLDGNANRAQAPNENFAREVMELFTLGEGQYGEADVREAARAFSGWTVRRETWQAVFLPKQFDSAPKTLFGHTEAYDMPRTLDLLLAQPAAARFITDKLWREFVSPDPDPRAAARAAATFRASGWQVAPVLRELLLSEAFWAPAARGALVKSPVELAVGTVRQFALTLDDDAPLDAISTRLGQSLFAPPNVKGWPGYTAWIDSTSLLERKRFTERLFRALENGDATRPMKPGMTADKGSDTSPGPGTETRSGMSTATRTGRLGQTRVRFDAEGWLAGFGARPDSVPDEQAAARIQAALLPLPAVNPVPAGTVGLSYLRAMTLDPAFQLK